ncbi:MAG: hypothetical protein HQL31_08890 [Planctomycetes bacterium]|nr:hypothetical protein [Planctomycetota bacterium]
MESLAPDLTTPEVREGRPAPGKRVKWVAPEDQGSEIYSALYLPEDWKKGSEFPVIVEYAGNKWQTSQGTVEGSSLGYGISGGEGVIWVCMPFVDRLNQRNATNWWGDAAETVESCKRTLGRICDSFGGDSANVFIAGFSRGSIACNYIGLYDDEIAALWQGFICHSHYEEPGRWPDITQEGAAERLKRLKGRAQFISHEGSVAPTKRYLEKALPGGNFTFLDLPFPDHTDTWVLRDIPERKVLREWFHDNLNRND